MPHFDHHVFICTNRRDADNPRGSCAARGSEEIRECFKKEVALRGLKRTVRANVAGCLDQCEAGPAVVVYPEEIWYTVPTVADAREIVESHLVGGVPVERLRMKDVVAK